MAIAESMPRQEGNQMHTILSASGRRRSGGAPKRPPAPGNRRVHVAAAKWQNCGAEAFMPKLKTHQGAAKRFKKTANSGKFLRGKAFKQHILTSKTRKRKRSCAAPTVVSPTRRSCG